MPAATILVVGGEHQRVKSNEFSTEVATFCKRANAERVILRVAEQHLNSVCNALDRVHVVWFDQSGPLVGTRREFLQSSRVDLIFAAYGRGSKRFLRPAGFLSIPIYLH